MTARQTVPFDSSRYSVEHAERRLDEFKAEWKRFGESHPYGLRVEQNADQAVDAHKLVLVKPFPRPLSGIAFDAINNLRSALDQAGHDIALAAGTKGRDAHFPFGGTATAPRKREGRSKDIPEEIFELMLSFQPYAGGDALLLAVNKLANTPKHETLVRIEPIVLVPSAFFGDVTVVPGEGGWSWPPRWDGTKNEMVLFRVPRGKQPKYDLKVGALVEFTQVDAIRGQPADAVLNAMIGKVASIIDALEAESRRLGLMH
ncbi:MAG: hypothetical protein M3Z54_15090 [Gemmatimonadota bacterium]|nr:hypothetical protein [Gemmatimonadota bacterium]